MGRHVWFIVGLLAVSGLAGCVQPSEETRLLEERRVEQQRQAEVEQRESQPEVVVDERRAVGAIDGRVTDDEALPIAGALVELVGYNATARATSEGSFRFGRINAGQYLLRVTHDSFEPRSTGVEVAGDASTRIDIVLTPLPGKEAYVETGQTFSGLFGAAACVSQPDGSTCYLSSPGTAVPEAVRTLSRDYFLVDGGWATIRLELTWDAATDLARIMGIQGQAPSVTANGCTYNYDLLPVAGTSPLEWRLDLTMWDQLRAEDETLCGSIQQRFYFEVFPSSEGTAASGYAEQRFTVSATLAYFEPLGEV